MTTAAAVRSQMTHRSAVERDQAGTDAEGNPQAPAWAVHIAALACWVWPRGVREEVEDDRMIVVEDLRALVPRGTDIRESDRIAQVTDRRGQTVHTGPLDVRGVIDHGTHLELVLEAVRS